ncbi:GNAT family N-acetyltransferase [Haloplasma contractile]|uniref:Phospholipiddiacylglycerol acyltransferase protein n=1 Tax=Haloplasma contractile SSD-17B TaxID=1033810 RepID=F7PSI8_9MOLU|nr:GNAT family N-acetyltransferase [Haloplasma contractile]ERJ12622.1 phospholipiddiacylglycerol acyltransferase protein [Haloplasma contractile SSD-17B]
MTIYVRDAILSDQLALNDLAYNLYFEYHKNRPGVFKNQKNAFSLKLLKDLLTSDTDQVIVAYNKQGDLLGYAYFTYKTTKESSLCHERKFTEVTEICTKSSHKRLGVASKLHNEIVKRARDNGYPIIELDVWFFNDEAISFYKKLGFIDKNKKMELLINQ